jgi:DNA-binding HxlR family transcriptional regulator
MARAADLVGDTCSLLIVRDLLVAPRRFGEIEESLKAHAQSLSSSKTSKPSN